jgi:hypothetical protein
MAHVILQLQALIGPAVLRVRDWSRLLEDSEVVAVAGDEDGCDGDY